MGARLQWKLEIFYQQLQINQETNLKQYSKVIYNCKYCRINDITNDDDFYS